MARNIVRDVAAKITQQGVRYVQPVLYGEAQGLLLQAYNQILRDFRVLAAPFTINSPIPSVLAGVWSITRETLIVGDVDRSIKEAVAVAVSKSNECPYCIGVHTVMLHAGARHDVVTAITTGDYCKIKDERLRATVAWALVTNTPDSSLLQTPPFSEKETPEIIGTALAFHYINRMVNIFLADSPVTSSGGKTGFAGRIFGATFGKRVVSVNTPKGESMLLLPSTPFSKEFPWAKPDRVIADVFSRFDAALDEAVQPILSDTARAVIQKQIDIWHGQSMGISSKWTEEVTAGLRGQDLAVARVALLTALASYQVDTQSVQAFRSYFPDDAQLIALTGWASFAAAKRIGTWLHKAN